MATSPREEEKEVRSVMSWLLNNPKYIRQVRDRGDGSFTIAPPKDVFVDEGIDGGDQIVALPSDLAGQIGLEQDPIMHVYTMPLES